MCSLCLAAQNQQLPTWCTGNIDGYSLTRTANRFPNAFVDQVAGSTLSAVMTISDTSCISNYTWSDMYVAEGTVSWCVV